MNCPAEIAGIVLQILEDGVLAARFAAWHNDAKLAGIEASHIHNLPSLLREYEAEKLLWYWEAERPAYIEAFAKHIGDRPTQFQSYWAQLEALLPDD